MVTTSKIAIEYTQKEWEIHWNILLQKSTENKKEEAAILKTKDRNLKIARYN